MIKVNKFFGNLNSHMMTAYSENVWGILALVSNS